MELNLKGDIAKVKYQNITGVFFLWAQTGVNITDCLYHAYEVRLMDFYTAVLRKSGNYWVALCLENGIVGQGNTKDTALEKLKEAVESFDDILKSEQDIYNEPLHINELHEFLSFETDIVIEEAYELKKVYA
ncbi:protein family [Candidatus Magnetobacterium bavaricum]|uniref:Protein family n=1 Tax=Candidatus Magnetobacterium bavaricum TaxID=29290 RepID=A0A0F3GTX7_9BACT|nr:protein family [Candidatus Magnetobacterium bavaricum]